MQFSNPRASKNLMGLTTSFGEDNTLALSQIMNSLNEVGIDGKNVINGGVGLYGKSTNAFLESVKKYQEAILEYRELIKSKSSASMIKAGKQLHQYIWLNIYPLLEVSSKTIYYTGFVFFVSH